MDERCRVCGAGLRDDLEWCPRCQAPRTTPEPAYGQTGLPHATHQARLGRWEWSQRGFGPVLRLVLTVSLIALILYVTLFVNFIFAIALIIVVGVVLRDVWQRHHDWL